ncbi:MAG: FkbM family methyltransferase [Thermoanaerobaculia bacterium]|nr:FkbM family methyltransferase [Thermoanaerobaculia bacterium]
MRNEIFDRQTLEIASALLRSDSSTVDVGCHRGKLLAHFLSLAPDGRHFAIEPIPSLVARLRELFPGARVFEVALSNRSGEAKFYVFPRVPGLSGLGRRDAVVGGELEREEIRVRTERLDAILPAGAQVDLIKIDVEGAEGLVIEGALQTLRRCRPLVVFEHFRQSSTLFGVSSGDLYDLLVERCGLTVMLPRRWLRGGRGLSRREFTSSDDGFYVASPLERTRRRRVEA